MGMLGLTWAGLGRHEFWLNKGRGANESGFFVFQSTPERMDDSDNLLFENTENDNDFGELEFADC